MIGSFGSVIFSASTDMLRTFRDHSKSYGARFAKHELSGKKPLLEFIGPDTTTQTMSIRLDINNGVSPQREIDRLVEMNQEGEAEPLVIGSNFMGLYVITKLDESDKVYGRSGQLRLAEVTLSLEEYADDRS